MNEGVVNDGKRLDERTAFVQPLAPDAIEESGDRPAVARRHTHQLGEATVETEADLVEVLTLVRLAGAARITEAASNHVFDRDRLACVQMTNVLADGHHVARELVA